MKKLKIWIVFFGLGLYFFVMHSEVAQTESLLQELSSLKEELGSKTPEAFEQLKKAVQEQKKTQDSTAFFLGKEFGKFDESFVKEKGLGIEFGDIGKKFKEFDTTSGPQKKDVKKKPSIVPTIRQSQKAPEVVEEVEFGDSNGNVVDGYIITG